MSGPMCALNAPRGLVYAQKTRTVREEVMNNNMLTREHAAASVVDERSNMVNAN